MNKRTFLALATATCLLPTLALADGFVDYTPGLIQSELDAGNTVFVDYSAEWCSTCARQERVISALREANSAYGEAMTFIKVDWDTYARDDVTTSRAIPRRSTLLVLRGNDELGRIVAGTSESQIQELMDKGL
jgi:thioredoxin 1